MSKGMSRVEKSNRTVWACAALTATRQHASVTNKLSLCLPLSVQPTLGTNTRALSLSVTRSLSRQPTSVTNTHGQRKLGSQQWMDTRRLTMGSAGGHGDSWSLVS
jgi:hypothetical protein